MHGDTASKLTGFVCQFHVMWTLISTVWKCRQCIQPMIGYVLITNITDTRNITGILRGLSNSPKTEVSSFPFQLSAIAQVIQIASVLTITPPLSTAKHLMCPAEKKIKDIFNEIPVMWTTREHDTTRFAVSTQIVEAVLEAPWMPTNSSRLSSRCWTAAIEWSLILYQWAPVLIRMCMQISSCDSDKFPLLPTISRLFNRS